MRKLTPLALIVVLAACSRGHDSSSRLRIQWNGNNSLSGLTGPFGSLVEGMTSWGLKAPTTTAAMDCIAVLISDSGGGGPNSCDNGSIETRFNQAAGFAGPGETLTLELASGPGRVIKVIGVTTLSGNCAQLSSVDRLEVSNPRVIFETTRDLTPGDNIIEVTPNMSGAELGSCAGPSLPAQSARCDLIGPASPGTFEDGSVLVHLIKGAALAPVLSRIPGASLGGSWTVLNSHHVQLPAGTTATQAATEFCRDARVQFVEPVKDTFSPRYYTSTFDNSSATNANAVVAVLSTGIDTSHSSLSQFSALWNSGDLGSDEDGNGFINDVHGWNFFDGNSTLSDGDGLGTHNAGTVLSAAVNIVGTAVVSSSVKVMPVRVVDDSGTYDSTRVASGILYSVQNNADVVFIGVGEPAFMEIVRRAVIYASNRGVSVIAPAGNSANDNDTTATYPASFSISNVISVGSHNGSSIKSSFSNFGLNSVHIFEAGQSLLSLAPGNSFTAMSGTSMAAAGVAGAVAFNKNSASQLSGFQLKQILITAAAPEAGLAAFCSTGGRLDSAAFTSAMPAYSATAYQQPQQ